MRCFCFLTIFLLANFGLIVNNSADGYDGRIIFAVNAGGDKHTDQNGIRYQKDNLKGLGVSSDYGKHLISIGRIHQQDQILYQTERYSSSTFGYDIPIEEDGDYVMVLKFCEVYFNAPNMKVFDVVLNGDHTIISDLDIYDKVGHGNAYDIPVPFTVSDNSKTLHFNEQESEIRGGKIRIEFIKGYRDNPKVNAIFVMKGTEADIPQLPPVPAKEEEEEVTEEPEEPPRSKNRKPSGPKVQDPYENVTLTSAIFPVFIAIGCFVPILFCLCKL